MLASMTGFVRHDTAGTWGTLQWEIRCVNHRYYDPHFRLPEGFTALEPALRQRLQQTVLRGRCDIMLHYLPATFEEQMVLHLPLARQLLEKMHALAQVTPLPVTCNLSEVLRWPGVLHSATVLSEAQQEWVMASFTQAINHLQQERLREGSQLKAVLDARVMAIENHMQAILQRIPALLPDLKQRLRELLQPVTGEYHPERLEQELVYFAHRLDVAEECDRFCTHLDAFRACLQQGGVAGRRLDFLLQEMHREVNTLGNKTGDKVLSPHTIEIKVLLEQIREQVQNLE